MKMNEEENRRRRERPTKTNSGLGVKATKMKAKNAMSSSSIKNDRNDVKECRSPSSSSKARGAREIDDIFQQLQDTKRMKREKDDNEDSKEDKEVGLKSSDKGGMGENSNTSDNNLGRMRKGEWLDDGLGGIYNRDGWTGRKSKEGFRIFKTHLLMRQNELSGENKKNGKYGSGKCPFDCSCCFI